MSPVILNGYETWSLILREEHEVKVFEKCAGKDIWAQNGERKGMEKTA
jgi:hypothetical protein